MKLPSSVSLQVYHQFKASHSLPGFDEPHFHLWKISVEFKGALPLKTDRLIDLVLLENEMINITSPLSGTYLNESLGTSPTSENMASYIWNKVSEKFPLEPLHSVSITLCNLEGVESGKATIS